LPLGGLIALLLVIEMALVLGARNFGLSHFALPGGHGAGYSNTAALGMQLYTTYVYPFEVAAVILLVAIVAAIALTMRRRKGTKYQNPSSQISVQRASRVRLVKMESEKPSVAADVKG
ncbi:MAG: NADH-quinone oxidoreductase subunit J, partial [Pseudomonadota bacterium]|nr:NADH-quinone oxidoreductase subunit J [Pseudomonadota bacterium]